jgi:hypothetical protein
MRRHRCIFVHVPKVAGTSVLQALSGLERPPRDHCSWQVYYQADSRKFSTYFKFAFVRNPWDRIASVYAYLARGGNGTTDAWFRRLVDDEDMTFARFLCEYLDQDRIHQHLLFMPQYRFLVDHEDRVMVDVLGRYERFPEDYAAVAARLGLRAEAPWANRSQREGYRSLYKDPALVDAVGRLYRKDAVLFGYEF